MLLTVGLGQHDSVPLEKERPGKPGRNIERKERVSESVSQGKLDIGQYTAVSWGVGNFIQDEGVRPVAR